MNSRRYLHDLLSVSAYRVPKHRMGGLTKYEI